MTWLPALWLFGTVVSLGYFLTGLFRLRRLRRECVPVSDERTLRLGREIGQRLGVARGVTMLRAEPGSGIRAPMTWGFLRPVVLLPDFLSEWPDESLRAALLHEFAHIRRADWLTQIVTFAACSLYWFHPGVWRMAAILRQDGEQSCDDIVLLAGVAPTTYAGSLLEVISMQKESRSAPTLAQSMGQPPIEMRVRAILAQSHPRLVSRATGVCTILLGALLLVPLSAARVNAGSPAVQPDATIAMLSRPEQTVQTVAQSSPDPARQTKAASVTALQKRLNRAEAENKKLRRMLDSARQQNRAVSELEINRLRAQMQQLEQQLQAATRVAVPLPNRRAPQPFSTEGRFQLIKRAEALQQQKALLDIQVEQAMAAYRSGVTTQSSAVALKAQRDLLALKIAKARLDLNDYNAGKRLSKRERDRRDLEYQLAGLRIQKDAKLQAAATLEARVKVGAESPATLISLKAELAGLDARIAEFEKRLADVKTSE